MIKKRMTLEKQLAWSGRLFVLPFVIGFLLFFLKPLLQSLYFVFQKVSLEIGGFRTEFVGVKNIKYIFLEDPDYVRKLVESLVGMIYQVPLIIIFSLFMAVVINQKFRGRLIVRSIFFLPVIISSGVIIQILKDDVFASNLTKGETAYMFQSFGLRDILIRAGMVSGLIDLFTNVSNSIFELMWKSGIQILLFLAALQTIPPPLYEASSIEGATAWENFWKITIPMISPIILVNIVYSIIDSFTDYGNKVMLMISDASIGMQFENAAAMSWVYFLGVFIIIGIAVFVMSKWVFYSGE